MANLVPGGPGVAEDLERLSAPRRRVLTNATLLGLIRESNFRPLEQPEVNEAAADAWDDLMERVIEVTLAKKRREERRPTVFPLRRRRDVF